MECHWGFGGYFAECFTWNTASLQQPNCFTWNAEKECGAVEQQIASSLILWCFGRFTWNTGRGGWVVGDGFWELFSSSSLPRSWRFTWNRRIVGSSFWLLEECGSISLLVIMRDCFLVIRFPWVYLLGVDFFFFGGGGLHRRIFVLWLERWVYWVGCRVSRETFCWIISRLVELIQICLWEWLKLEAYSVVGKVHSRQQKTIRKEHAI